ncbi:MAG: beta strand repeat-containing protein, partial [Chthoniobacter sp.]
KDGTGTLTLGASGALTTYQTILINSGNLDFHDGGRIATYPNITLANMPSAALTLGSANFVGGLNGGGANGGIVRPESTVVGRLTLYLNGTGSFAGSLQDNGAGILEIETYPSANQTFTGTNTYSGTTAVDLGTLIFTGQGSARNTSGIDIYSNGTSDALILDNSSINNGDRLSNTAPINLGGNLTFIGNKAAPASETLGGLTIQPTHTSFVTVMPDSAQTSTLSFSSIGVTTASTLPTGLVVLRGEHLGAAPGAGVANIRLTTLPTLVGGGGAAGSKTMSILPYAVGDSSATGVGNSFVAYDVNGLRPLADTEYANNDFTIPGANVNVDSAATVSGAASVTSLRLKNGADITGSGSVTVTSGMLLQLPGVSNIRNAQLDFGANAVVLDIQGTTNISSSITGTNSVRGIDKLGNGRLILSGANTYAGPTYVSEGVLNIQNGSALGAGGSFTNVLLGAVLEVQGNIHVGNEGLLLQGPGLGSLPARGALRSISGNNIWDGAVSTQGASNIGVDSGSLTINGTFSGNLTKVGRGSLIFAKVWDSSNGTGNITDGWLVSTATSGNPFGILTLSNSGMEIAPSGSGGAIALGQARALTYNGGVSLKISKGSNSSLTFTIAGAQGGSNSTMVVIPGSGLAGLGVTEKLVAPLGNPLGGILPASVVGQDNDADRSATFLTYSMINGVVPALFGGTDLNTAGVTVFQASTDQILTADRQVFALRDNGHVIDLAGKQLTVGSNNVTSGIILNGGTIQNGTLNMSGTSGAIYTSLAGGAISTPIVADPSAGIAFFGPGKLTLSSANTYLGITYVNGGNLNLQGSITSQVLIAPSAVLSGTGRTTKAISGGTISPGDGGAGILTASSVGIQEVAGSTTMGTYTNFAFQFTKTGLPNFGSATASENDVLHLTNPGAAFSGGALSDANEVDLYFNVSFGLQMGQTYVGGFFTDQSAAFDSAISGADYKFFVSDPLGTMTFDGVTYSSIDGSQIALSTVPLTADFGSGAVNGYAMQVQVVPEPGSLVAMLSGVVVLGSFRRRRRI